MILPLPKHFDANEWFILLTTAAGYIVLAFLPIRYPRVITVLLVMFCISSAYVYDHALVGPPLRLYEINDYPQYELMDCFTYVMYSPYALLCVYVYHKLNPRQLWFTGYIVCWSLFCTFFEWLAIRFHVFSYHGWSLVYSFSVYLVMTTIYLWFFEYLMKHFREAAKKKTPSPGSVNT